MQNEAISVQEIPVSAVISSTSWSRQDTTWMLSLFGTAVGAGILFLPINAGMGGFWPLVLMALMIGPMTYLAHRGLSRFLCSSAIPGSDITQVVEEHFGTGAGKAITWLYFLAIYPIVLIYGVGITNTVDSFIINQLGMFTDVPRMLLDGTPALTEAGGQIIDKVSGIPRWLLSGMLILGMMSVMVAGEKFMLSVTRLLVYPLVAILAFMSLYLIPDWKFDALMVVPSTTNFFGTVWLTIPVLVFAFNHSPAISQFSVSLKKEHGANASHKADVILRNTAIMLVGFVMLFVFSCVLSLTPAQLLEAKADNLPILSYLANVHESGFISYFAPVIAFIAIISSFFGHYMGATEGLKGIIIKQLPDSSKPENSTKVDKFILGFMFITTWAVAIMNPSILGMIEALGGPVIAAILYLMPMYAIYKVPALKAYRGRLSNIFVVITGLLSMTAILFGLLS